MNVLNVGDAAHNNLVQSMISIQRILGILLFDSGCIHSFISYGMIGKLNLKLRMLELSLIVSTLNGGENTSYKYVSSTRMSV